MYAYGDLVGFVKQKQEAWDKVKDRFEGVTSLRQFDDDMREYVWDWMWQAPYRQMALTQLNDQLFLGSCLEATNTAALDAAGITTVCNLSKDHYDTDIKFRYHQFGQDDKVPVPPAVIEKFLMWMDERVAAGDKILIHCQMGISRTPAFAIAWFLHKAGANKDTDLIELWSDVEDQVRKVRGFISVHHALKDSILAYFNGGVSPWKAKFQR